MYDSVNCKIKTSNLQPMLRYPQGDDKSDYIRQQTWYINEFLGSHKDYSDVNEMSEVLERLTFINPSFVRKEMLQVAIKKMFERFKRFLTLFDIDHLMSLLKLIPTLLLKSKIQCPRYAMKHVEMTNAIEDFIQSLVKLNSYTDQFDDERINFFLQFFTDNTLDECESQYISRISLDKIELKRNSADRFSITGQAAPPKNTGFENSGIEVITTKESSSGNYKRDMAVDRQRGNSNSNFYNNNNRGYSNKEYNKEYSGNHYNNRDFNNREHNKEYSGNHNNNRDFSNKEYNNREYNNRDYNNMKQVKSLSNKQSFDSSDNKIVLDKVIPKETFSTGMVREPIPEELDTESTFEEIRTRNKRFNEKMILDEDFEHLFIKSNGLSRIDVEDKINTLVKMIKIPQPLNEFNQLFNKFFTKHETFTIGSYTYNYLYAGLNDKSKEVDFLILKADDSVPNCNSKNRINHYIDKFNDQERTPNNTKYNLGLIGELDAKNNQEFRCRLIDNSKSENTDLRFILYKPEYKETYNIIKDELNKNNLLYVNRFLQDLLFKALPQYFKTRYQITMFIISYLDHKYNIFTKSRKSIDNKYYHILNQTTKDKVKDMTPGDMVLDIFRYLLNFMIYIREKVNAKTNTVVVKGFDKLKAIFERNESALFNDAYLFNLTFFFDEYAEAAKSKDRKEAYNKMFKSLSMVYFKLWECSDKIESYEKLLEIYKITFP
jgi:hypothetical protein